MRIELTTVHVDDQEKALRFYTEVLGFVKKADFSQGPFRWLTVASPQNPGGTQLQLALNDNPAARAYQQAAGAEFTMAPTEATGSRIAKLNDTCGNLIQITQLMRW
jgi:predicted enzyme related to lactoylglutathione lyase